jgi:hypothetical protein
MNIAIDIVVMCTLAMGAGVLLYLLEKHRA